MTAKGTYLEISEMWLGGISIYSIYSLLPRQLQEYRDRLTVAQAALALLVFGRANYLELFKASHCCKMRAAALRSIISLLCLVEIPCDRIISSAS